ncbi:MAG TPA: phenylalanine--tRNA ligase subunit alpha [Verrucomicrobiae bacterium]|jgi:phenylalanyl-tRNA synthetase alpha chain|nr:phenylalanine--tRNA ligase subunit alpha [Verrucomicrobiae bacterium]
MAYTVPKLEDYSPAALDSAVRELLAAVRQEAGAVSSENEWKEFRDRWMARKNGILTQVNDLWLKAAPGPSKRDVGARVNQLKVEVEQTVDAAQSRASGAASHARVESDRLDITLPGIRRPLGAEHPVIKTMHEVIGVFRAMGYSVAEGPEIETDYYNFESLNFPPNHPARDTQDTIFIAGQEKKQQRDRLLLRTHTSPVQIHSMEKQPPPIRVVVPGKVHRADTADATHSPIFHQVEGLAVDTNITFCDLKGTLDHAMKALFGSSVKTRFYPSFFPFTEPSADVQITCFKCGGKGCRLCKQSGWIELLGCGMVDPNVFKFVESNGYDANKVSGFAFGMGVERITMLKYGIDDIQLFYQGDVRFLEQFA